MKKIILGVVLVLGLVGLSLTAVSATESDPVCTDKVIDVPAHDVVISEAGWQRYSWTGGPHDADTAPGFPSPDWQPNVKGDPHNVGVAGAYFRSNGNSGKGDWFYLEATPAVTEHVPDTYKDVEVPCEEEPPTEEPPVVTPPKTDPPTKVDPPETDEPSVDKPKVGLPNTGA